MQINPSRVIKFLEKKVKPFFKFELSERSRFSEDKIFKLLVQMIIQNSFAEGTCNYQKIFTEVPGSDTFLRCIKNTNVHDIQNNFCFFNKRAIKIAKRQGLFNLPLPIAIDWIDIMFYGDRNFDKNLRGAIEMFRKRWGIETGYRMIDQFLPKTTSKNYIVRMFYFFFGCIMYNAWILFNLIKSTIKRYLHIPVLFFKNLILRIFLSSKTFS